VCDASGEVIAGCWQQFRRRPRRILLVRGHGIKRASQLNEVKSDGTLPNDGETCSVSVLGIKTQVEPASPKYKSKQKFEAEAESDDDWRSRRPPHAKVRPLMCGLDV
jgi:hypothetical protein